jgi:hypothetical protein
MIHDHEPGTCAPSPPPVDEMTTNDAPPPAGRPLLLQKYLKRFRCQREA